MAKPKVLRVVPNPYFVIDEEGRAVGVVACDPKFHTPDRRWVGAVVRSNPRPRPAFDTHPPLKNGFKVDDRKPIHDIWWDVTGDVVELPDPGPHATHYPNEIRGGAMFAVDDHTHERAFGTPPHGPDGNPKPRRPWQEQRAEARLAGIKRFALDHQGEAPSFAHPPSPEGAHIVHSVPPITKEETAWAMALWKAHLAKAPLPLAPEKVSETDEGSNKPKGSDSDKAPEKAPEPTKAAAGPKPEPTAAK